MHTSKKLYLIESGSKIWDEYLDDAEVHYYRSIGYEVTLIQ